MQTTQKSPRIIHFSWGRLQVEGINKTFKDAKLFPGGAREWDWNETSTSHGSGIQPADAKELLDKGASVIVLGKGVNGRLNVSPETLRMLDKKGIPSHVLQTEEAVKLYNKLCTEQLVGGLFHSTC